MQQSESTNGRRRIPVLAGATLGAAVVVGVGLRRRKGRARAARADRRWQTVTVDCPPDDSRLPGRGSATLTDLDFEVEIDVRAEPGGQGAELRARPAEPQPGDGSAAARLRGTDPAGRLRVALRSVKQSIEAGEVLRVDPAPHGHRPSTPTGWLLDLSAKRSEAGGLK